MNILFDTNVILDALLDREPWAKSALILFQFIEFGHLKGYLGATTLTTIHYIARRNVGTHKATAIIGDLLQLFEVASVTRVVIENALKRPFKDFEDAVLHEAGRLIGVDAIVTRDMAGFDAATLRIYSTEELIASLSTTYQ
jgi:predicted nucleic acid-binding protein